MYLGVSEHVPLEGERLAAVVTLVRSLRFVSRLVLLQVTSVLECSLAGLALVGLILAVSLEVASQC